MRWLSLSIRRQPDGTQDAGARAAFTSPAGNAARAPAGSAPQHGESSQTRVRSRESVEYSR